MYHSHFTGSHYQAGFRWGKLLLNHGNRVLENIPFEITRERIEYGESCVPVYKKYYPEILEEIRGIAQGQKCSLKILQAFLFGMYAVPPQCSCSCFATAGTEGILLGRNSDFFPESRRLNMNVIYRFSGNAIDFTGNTTAFVEMEDGINARGLAAGLTSVFPAVRQPGFNAGILLRYLLEKCGTVTQAVEAVKKIPAGSSCNLILADTTGDIVSMEVNPVKKIFMPARDKGSRISYLCAVNRFRHPEMQEYNNPEIDDWFSGPRLKTMEGFFSNNPEIDDWFSGPRLKTMEGFFSSAGSGSGKNITTLQSAKELLSGKYGFLCQYEKASGKDTVWSVVYDLKNLKIYRAEGNPSRCRFREDERFFRQ